MWYAVEMNGIIGPYFFEDDDVKTVTVNADRNNEMMQNFLRPVLARKRILSRIYFQQDGATSHTCTKAILVLDKMFGLRIISKNRFLP